MYCKHCGKEIEENSAFCKYCGKQLVDKRKITIEFNKPSLKGFKDYSKLSKVKEVISEYIQVLKRIWAVIKKVLGGILFIVVMFGSGATCGAILSVILLFALMFFNVFNSEDDILTYIVSFSGISGVVGVIVSLFRMNK